jgi:hypothetical protein
MDDKDFLTNFINSSLNILDTMPQTGPDGWPYLLVETRTKEHESTTQLEDSRKVLNWLSDKGIGLVVNPKNETPDYIFTYGMIWNFKERHEFYTDRAVQNLSEIDERFLPQYVRKILRTFFLDNGIKEMKILLLITEDKNFDLCFSLESAGSPPENEHMDFLEAVSWFLPAHYSLRLVSEEGLPKFQVL